MDYEQKKVIADAYLMQKAGIGWDDLSDINSLHDAEDEKGILDLCKARLVEDGFRFDVEEE